MKLFTKLALVSAVAISGQAMAMQSMDDSALSSTTGQEGITLTIKTDEVKIGKLIVHDNDGLSTAATISPTTAATAGGTATGGGITVNGVSVKVDTTSPFALASAGARAALGLTNDVLAIVKVDADAGAGGTAPVLNVNMLNNAMAIHVDSIGVGASNSVASMAGKARRGVTSEVSLIENVDLTIGASALNIQLGNQPQGAMIAANGVIGGGIRIANLTVNDNVGGGQVGIQNMAITSADSTNLTVNTLIGVNNQGLSIKSTGANDIYMGSIKLGDLSTAASLGSIEIQGMEMVNSEILVSGH
ncbi:putative pilus system protein FilA [Alkanindiges illinoisensis]|uniref:putative pilus system protein FilA n=1 Tax=Alkanindiges illinoisensis TaxID=197183 RepID=UPI0004799CCF